MELFKDKEESIIHIEKEDVKNMSDEKLYHLSMYLKNC
jgi:hypothetical protein